jgi:DNA-binding GntR family transcriptional regulator
MPDELRSRRTRTRTRTVTPPAAVVSLAEEAYVAIREEILRGQLRPGAPLSRRRLARHFGMSTVPIADALRRLEEDGMVESRARAGTRVRVPTAQDVRELYELREALESQSARLFAARATPAQRREIMRLAENVDVLFTRLATSGDDPAFRFTVNSHHMALHTRVAEYAASPLVKQVIERKHVLIMNWLFDVTGRRTPLPPGFHARLAEALTSGSPETADAAMRAHVRYGLREISSGIEALEPVEWRERRGKRR